VSVDTPAIGSLLDQAVIAPSGGRITVLLTGACYANSTDQAYLYATAGTETFSAFYGASTLSSYLGCTGSASVAVTKGQSLHVAASWTHDTSATLEAVTILVLFQPAVG
jgi:hypothetical protein